MLLTTSSTAAISVVTVAVATVTLLLNMTRRASPAAMISCYFSQHVFTPHLQVIFFSMIIALIFKTIEEDDDVCERQNNAKPSPDEEIIEESLEELRTFMCSS